MTKETLYPAYLTKKHIDRAPNLKLAFTAGVGSDHFELEIHGIHNLHLLTIHGEQYPKAP